MAFQNFARSFLLRPVQLLSLFSLPPLIYVFDGLLLCTLSHMELAAVCSCFIKNHFQKEGKKEHCVDLSWTPSEFRPKSHFCRLLCGHGKVNLTKSSNCWVSFSRTGGHHCCYSLWVTNNSSETWDQSRKVFPIIVSLVYWADWFFNSRTLEMVQLANSMWARTSEVSGNSF